MEPYTSRSCPILPCPTTNPADAYPLSRIFNTQVYPKGSAIHTLLYNYLVSLYNRLVLESEYRRKVNEKDLLYLGLLMLACLKSVYVAGCKVEESPYKSYQLCIGTPHLLESNEKYFSHISYEFRIGPFAYIEDTNELVDLRYKKEICLEPGCSSIIISREFIVTPENICGCIITKLTPVLAGIMHIETILHPLYHGPIILRLVNVRKKSRSRKLLKNRKTLNGNITLSYSRDQRIAHIEFTILHPELLRLKEYQEPLRYLIEIGLEQELAKKLVEALEEIQKSLNETFCDFLAKPERIGPKSLDERISEVLDLPNKNAALRDILRNRSLREILKQHELIGTLLECRKPLYYIETYDYSKLSHRTRIIAERDLYCRFAGCRTNILVFKFHIENSRQTFTSKVTA